MRTPPAIGFEYHPSRTLSVCIVALTALAALAIAVSGVAPWLIAILIVLALGYGALSLWRFLHPRVQALTWRSDGTVSIGLVASGEGTTEVQGVIQDARVLGPLIALRLRWLSQKPSNWIPAFAGMTARSQRGAVLWLLPDNLDADTRRRLRVRLNADGALPASGNADNV